MILAMDSATSACSAAIWNAGGLIAHDYSPMNRGQAEALAPMIQGVLAEAGISVGELEGLAVTVGPGAFTGVRIGLAMARGLAIASGVKLCGLGTMEVVAGGLDEAEREGKSVLVALKTKRADIYVQGFGPDLDPISTPAACLPEALADLVPPGPLLVAGDEGPLVTELLGEDGVECGLSSGPALPDAAVIARLAARRIAGDGPLLAPEPIYLRPLDVTPPSS
jgi:tRNA threonylcarbamoyladenosine biosynthesis protein TsaB